MRTNNRDHNNSAGQGKGGFWAKATEAAASVANKALDVVSPERQSKAVNEYVSAQDENYRMMRELIENDPEMPTEKKIELLRAISADYEEKQKNAGTEISKVQKETGEVVLKVLTGILSAGISTAPELIKKYKEANPQLIESEDYIDADVVDSISQNDDV